MKVLLSIKPEFAEKILLGEKKYEFRKIGFRDKHVRTVVIYATRPIGKVIGEFEIGTIIEDHPEKIWEQTTNYSGISESFFREYFGTRAVGYAIQVKKAKRYKKPIELTAIVPHGKPPQSFCYIQ